MIHVSILLTRAIQESLSEAQIEAFLSGLKPILLDAEHEFMELLLQATNTNPELMMCELHSKKIEQARQKIVGK